jgi:hypothetical protein
MAEEEAYPIPHKIKFFCILSALFAYITRQGKFKMAFGGITHGTDRRSNRGRN